MTPTLAQLTDLRDRVRAATGPDRELDCRIWAEFDGRDVRRSGNMLLGRSRRPAHDECLLGTYLEDGAFQAAWSNPPISTCTASLDAALALVERVLPSVWVRLDNWSDEYQGASAAITPKPKPSVTYGADAPTLSLAVLHVLVRALIAQQEAADGE